MLQLTDKTKYSLSTDNEKGITRLQISFLTEEDFGIYKVSITNDAGTSTRNVDFNRPHGKFFLHF